jgi:hypothetical protein
VSPILIPFSTLDNIAFQLVLSHHKCEFWGRGWEDNLKFILAKKECVGGGGYLAMVSNDLSGVGLWILLLQSQAVSYLNIFLRNSAELRHDHA